VAAAETTSLPPYGGIGTEVEIPGRTHSDRWDAMMVLSSDGYLQTIGSRLVRGRRLTEHDIEGARRVALVNETLVSKYLGSEDPIGREIQLTRLAKDPTSPVTNPLFEIVGVFADVKNRGIQDPPMPEVQVPYSVTGAFERGVLVRTMSNPLTHVN